MSISFSSIKGYHNTVNLGDTGYNSEKFHKNEIYTNGNPTNWNSNHNITKDKNKSVHTRFIEKVGSEVISNLNRDDESFSQRIQENISVYPKGQNLMATGINYGSTPYKIGDSSKTCKLDLGKYASHLPIYPLSRVPAKAVQIETNKSDFTHKPSNVNRTIDNHSINEYYTTANVNLNKMDKFYQNHSNLNSNLVNNKSINQNKLNYGVQYNKTKTNNFNNMYNAQHNKDMPIKENYMSVGANTNRMSTNNTGVNHDYIDTNKFVRNGTLLAKANTNLHKNFNELEVQRHPVRLENKLSINEGYNNNRVGVRAQTQNLQFKL
jgi:hypothetical protein